MQEEIVMLRQICQVGTGGKKEDWEWELEQRNRAQASAPKRKASNLLEPTTDDYSSDE
jgi:hypothetical protein